MKLRFEKRALPAAVILAALTGTAQFWAGGMLNASVRTNLIASGALAAAMLAASVVRVEFRSWLGGVLMQICAAFAGIFLLHYALLDGVNLHRTVFVNNYLLSLGLLLALAAVTGCPRAVGAFWLIFCFGCGAANCAVVQFRGNMITLGDVFSIRTALNVAGGYHFEIMPRLITEICVLATCLTAVLKSRVRRRSMRGLGRRTALLAMAAAAAWMPAVKLEDTAPRTWGREGAYFNGVLMQFLAEAEDMYVEPPEGYSQETVDALARKWPAQPAASADEQQPHIIAVMVEALSDLRVLGGFETSEAVMPVWDSLRSESVHGYALASVLGGGTSNSEWEFLTGNTMALMPAGSNVYRQYMRSAPNSIVQLLGNRGYRCVAMHPYIASSWDRNRIYPMMGFDECLFIDDLDWGETVRGRVSDSAFADRVIDRFEQRAPGEKLFLFGVTMQNHSDYDVSGFEATVKAVGLEGEYADVNQYLTLVKMSDAAVGGLIDYFRGVDEPVAVVIFGDHQPDLSQEFLDEAGVSSRQDRYKVPWMIWKNYDDASREIELTSLNYLPAILLESIGAQMPPYYHFLNEARQTLPAVNSLGCVVGGEEAALEDLSGEAAQMMADYRIWQYANMFDEDADGALFGG